MDLVAPALPEINKPSTNKLDRFQLKPKLSLEHRATGVHCKSCALICTKWEGAFIGVKSHIPKSLQMGFISSWKNLTEGGNTKEGCTEYFKLTIVILEEELSLHITISLISR